MEKENYRFNIEELGGATPKNDRIRKLVPIFEQKRFFLPEMLGYIDYEGKSQDFIRLFKDEYLSFPISEHDDIMDCTARIVHEDLKAEFPSNGPIIKMKDRDYSRYGDCGWML